MPTMGISAACSFSKELPDSPIVFFGKYWNSDGLKHKSSWNFSNQPQFICKNVFYLSRKRRRNLVDEVGWSIWCNYQHTDPENESPGFNCRSKANTRLILEYVVTEHTRKLMHY